MADLSRHGWLIPCHAAIIQLLCVIWCAYLATGGQQEGHEDAGSDVGSWRCRRHGGAGRLAAAASDTELRQSSLLLG